MTTKQPVVKRERSTDLPTLYGVCSSVLGRDLSAYAAGADTVDQLESWLSGGEGPDSGQARDRLQAAASVIEIFAVVNQVHLAQAWLREVGAVANLLWPPARLIREASSEDAAKPVLHAAMHYSIARE
jgi:hypothetical protein